MVFADDEGVRGGFRDNGEDDEEAIRDSPVEDKVVVSAQAVAGPVLATPPSSYSITTIVADS